MNPDNLVEHSGKEAQVRKAIEGFSTATEKLFGNEALRGSLEPQVTGIIRKDFNDPNATFAFIKDQQTGKFSGMVTLSDGSSMPFAYTPDALVKTPGEVESYPTFVLMRAVDHVVTNMDQQDELPLEEATLVAGTLDAFKDLAPVDTYAADLLGARTGKFNRFSRDTKRIAALQAKADAGHTETTGLQHELGQSRMASGELLKRAQEGEDAQKDMVRRKEVAETVRMLLSVLTAGKLEGGDETKIIAALGQIEPNLGIESLQTVDKILDKMKQGNSGEVTPLPNTPNATAA